VEALKDKTADHDVNIQLAVDDPDERPTSPPDGVEEFTDDDGTIYKWDRTLRAMVPQVSVAFLSLGFVANHHQMIFFWVFSIQDFRSLDRNHSETSTNHLGYTIY
jgi:hypothetical protein